MIWSFVKVAFFVALAAGLAFGSSLLLKTPGEVRIAFGGREISATPLGFVIALALLFVALWLLFRLAGFLAAFVRFLAGDETAFSRYWDRNREKKGYEALTEGLIALASGEGAAAAAKAAKAEKLLGMPDMTNLLNASAAEMAGDMARADAYYKELLKSERTRFTGVRGLMRARLAAGDTDKALKLAEKAFALKPRHGETIDTLFTLQSKQQDWAGARVTLEAKLKTRALPRDVGTRRDAVLSLAEAMQAQAKGDTATARRAAFEAHRLAPALVPAAALVSDIYVSEGNKRAAGKVLGKSWALSPHPDLAAAFARIEPDETPAARQKRFATLLKSGTSSEARLLEAELCLTCEDFPAARRAMGDLAEQEPTARSLAIMAAIERGEGSDDAAVRAWLARAIVAPRGNQWTCGACGQVHAQWAPVCEKCGGFDTLAWKTGDPALAPDATTQAMLPLIVGAREPEAAPEMEPPKPD